MNTVIIPLLHLFLLSGNVSLPGENQYVKADISLVKDVVPVGGEGTILISLVPIDGIHVNVDPPMAVKLEKGSVFAIRNAPSFKTDKESGFLLVSAPIEQRISVSSKAKPGEHTLKGTIIYYFCSDTEGWCTKFSQPIELNLNVVKR